MYPVLLNLRRKRLIINDYLITQAAPLVQIFFPGQAEVGGQVFQMGKALNASTTPITTMVCWLLVLSS